MDHDIFAAATTLFDMEPGDGHANQAPSLSATEATAGQSTEWDRGGDLPTHIHISQAWIDFDDEAAASLGYRHDKTSQTGLSDDFPSGYSRISAPSPGYGSDNIPMPSPLSLLSQVASATARSKASAQNRSESGNVIADLEPPRGGRQSPGNALVGCAEAPSDSRQSENPDTKPRRRRRNKNQSSGGRWEELSRIIKRLYVEEERSLEEVMAYMEKQHQFSEKEPAYKKAFHRWGVSKNIPSSEMFLMVATAEKRKRDDNKDTEFYIHDRLVDSKKLLRFRRRKIENGGDDVLNSSSLILPTHIRCCTPVTNSAPPASRALRDTVEDRPIGSMASEEPATKVVSPAITLTPALISTIQMQNVHKALGEREQERFGREIVPRDIDFQPRGSLDALDQMKNAISDSGGNQTALRASNLPSKPGTVLNNDKVVSQNVDIAKRFATGGYYPEKRVTSTNTTGMLDNMSTSESAAVPTEVQLRQRLQQLGAASHHNPIPRTQEILDSLHWIVEKHKSQNRLRDVVDELERLTAGYLFLYGACHELYLSQSINLAIIYHDRGAFAARDSVITRIAIGYKKFHVPVDVTVRDNDDVSNISLPTSAFRLCIRTSDDICSCQDLLILANVFRTTLRTRAVEILYARAIACYLQAGRLTIAASAALDIAKWLQECKEYRSSFAYVFLSMTLAESCLFFRDADWDSLFNCLRIQCINHTNNFDHNTFVSTITEPISIQTDGWTLATVQSITKLAAAIRAMQEPNEANRVLKICTTKLSATHEALVTGQKIVAFQSSECDAVILLEQALDDAGCGPEVERLRTSHTGHHAAIKEGRRGSSVYCARDADDLIAYIAARPKPVDLKGLCGVVATGMYRRDISTAQALGHDFALGAYFATGA